MSNKIPLERNIFENVQMFESSPSVLLNPEDCSATFVSLETLERLAEELIEPNPPERNFVPWFVYQAEGYLKLAIQKRNERIKKRYCE